MNIKSFSKIILVVALLAVVAVGVFVFIAPKVEEKPAEEGQLVGNDRDEHGCIGSAGYTWCGLKNKCLREWEEACSENPEQKIQ